MNNNEDEIILMLALLQMLQQRIDKIESDKRLEVKYKLKQRTNWFKESLELGLTNHYKNLSEGGQLTLFNRVNKLEHAIYYLYNSENYDKDTNNQLVSSI